jgi:hypothetical protein
MNERQTFTVTLTIRVGECEYVRPFVVEAPTERDAVLVAEQRMPHLPITDAVHSDPNNPAEGAWLEVVATSAVAGDTKGAWRWEGGYNGSLVCR